MQLNIFSDAYKLEVHLIGLIKMQFYMHRGWSGGSGFKFQLALSEPAIWILIH